MRLHPALHKDPLEHHPLQPCTDQRIVWGTLDKMRAGLMLLVVSLLQGEVTVQVHTYDVTAQMAAEQAMNLKFYLTGADKIGGHSTYAQHAAFTGTKPMAKKMSTAYRMNFLEFMSTQGNRSSEEIIASQNLTDSTGRCSSSPAIKCDRTAVFRTADGSCNNLQNRDWGQSFIPFRRFIPAQYGDGLSLPRVTGTNGLPLRGAREISVRLHTAEPGSSTQSNVSTHMTMQFAQFLDHDITLAPMERGEGGAVITCCPEDLTQEAIDAGLDVTNRRECFPINVSPGDRRFSDRSCLSFVRSVQVANAQCGTVPAEQVNILTAYVDGSQIYGSAEEEQFNLRAFIDGLLNISSSDPELLPRNPLTDTCITNEPPNFCFLAGDERVDEHMSLNSMHTIWLREHNRIARILHKLNPLWCDERLFQEARKIVGAMLQHITYTEFLPLVLSHDDIKTHTLTTAKFDQYHNSYDPTVDASIRSGFATAAYRFGHSLIQSVFNLRNTQFQVEERIRLRNSFGNTSIIIGSDGNAVNTFARGLARDRSRTVDQHISRELTDNLFPDAAGNAMDLMSLNIQRGRDHGIPGYNAWREFCGLSVPTNFGTGATGLVDHDDEARNTLNILYTSPADMDLFSAGVSETPVPGGLLGPTFSCIVARQFELLKIGDRFFYDNDESYTRFTRGQLSQLRQVSLARVICDNTDTTRIQPAALKIVGSGNRVTACSNLSKVNLAFWQEKRCFH